MHTARRLNTTIAIPDVMTQDALNKINSRHQYHKSASISLLGDRDSQQDSYGIWHHEQISLAVVADGAGGHRGGAQASATAVSVMQKLWEQRLCDGCSPEKAAELIYDAMLTAHHEIINASGGNSSLSGKSAIVVLYLSKGHYVVAHAGDCRMYHGHGDAWNLRTEDDSVLQMLINANRVRPEEIRNHPDQSILTQALGASSTPNPHVAIGTYSDKDSFLLCCDGFWNQLPEPLWSVPKWTCKSDKQHAELLSNLAQDAIQAADGNSDNVTAIWIFPAEGAKWTTTGVPLVSKLIACALAILAIILIAFAYFTWSSSPRPNQDAQTPQELKPESATSAPITPLPKKPSSDAVKRTINP